MSYSPATKACPLRRRDYVYMHAAKESPMTACIVGWSNGKFGKLDGETSVSAVNKQLRQRIGGRDRHARGG